MRAVVLEAGELHYAEVAEPSPGPGQVLVRTLACGICGTDLHARQHLHDFLGGLQRSGSALATDPDRPVVFGHEFCAEILDHGPETDRRFAPGTRVVGLPFLTSGRGSEYVGYSDAYPGGFGEQMVLTERLLFEVPEQLEATQAALTEPLSVGAHAVARAGVAPGDVVLVVGCGPIGLAVIAALKARGIGPVVGVDPVAARREFAATLGADEVVDPGVESQARVWSRYGTGNRGPRAVAFECVGRPGVAQSVIDEVPMRAVVVVVGNVLVPSTIDQVVAFNKELDVRFSLNYTPKEFGATLEDLARGRIDPDKLITGTIPPDVVPAAFDELATQPRHAKLVIRFGQSD